ncbi:MAG TPA: hypothetical protein VF774_13015, partial [Pseudoduganella sp.]
MTTDAPPNPPESEGAAPQAAGSPRPRLAGSYRILAADADGNLLDATGADVPADTLPAVPADPSDRRAVEIFFGLVDTSTMPPREQMELQADVDRVLRVIQRLYPKDSPRRMTAFRIYYVRLFNVARIGLEGADAAPDLARLELAKLTADLLDDEGGNVKNAHLRVLGKYAALYCLPFLALYALVCLLRGGGFGAALILLHINPDWVAGFCMLWVGCFNGVWLSYGIRKVKIVLADLVVGDDDRMVPQIRLLFAGSLASALGLMFALGVIDVEIGTRS